jgi:hypothetical protein
MTTYTPEMKQKILDSLHKVNAHLKDARDHSDKGSFDAAAKDIADAIDEKHLGVTSFPGVEPKSGLTIPFFPIFDLFEELDREARHILDFVNDMHGGRKPKKEDVEALIAKLKTLADELQYNLLDRYDLAGTTGAYLIQDLIEALKEVARLGDDINVSDQKDADRLLDRCTKALSKLYQLKREYLSKFPGRLDLAKAYDDLFGMDEGL